MLTTSLTQQVLPNNQYAENSLAWMWSDESEVREHSIRIAGGGKDKDTVVRAIECCGKHNEEFTKSDGSPGYVPFLCHQWHGTYGLFCDRCVNKRAKQHRDRIAWAIEENERNNNEYSNCVIVMRIVSVKEQEKIVRRLTSKNTLCCPLQNGQVQVFARVCIDDPLSEMLIIGKSNLDQVDWIESAKTPEGRKVSGHLGKPKSGEDDADDEKGKSGDNDEPKESIRILQLRVIIVNLKEDQRRAAWHEAIVNTAHLCPSSVEEQGEAMNQRTEAYVSAAVKRGGDVIYQHYKEITLSSRQVSSWCSREYLTDNLKVAPDTLPDLEPF